ncbi:MAG TPA: ferrochelatase [Nannocystis exedens]|nr:ferrochelatase [Nannocystis exedens]
MSHSASNPASVIAAADRRLDEASPARRSLAPDRGRARPLGRVIDAVCCQYGLTRGDAKLVDALSIGLAKVVLAQLRAFPRNIFWDFEFMAASVLSEALHAAAPASFARTRLQKIANLQRLYGCETAIRFTYVHDFVYGYDWAKWIARDPPPRRDHGPYSATFLDYMEVRAHQLLALISGNDRKYPILNDHQPRNAFPFSREPASEIRLHRELARRRELPIEAWKTDSSPQWNRRYAAIRAERARVLSHWPLPNTNESQGNQGNQGNQENQENQGNPISVTESCRESPQ